MEKAKKSTEEKQNKIESNEDFKVDISKEALNKSKFKKKPIKSSKKKFKSKEKSISIKEYQKIEKQLEEKTIACEQLNDKVFRVAAEFANYKKRSEKEIQDFHKYAGEKILKAFLPVLDDLERAIKHENNEDNSDKTDADGSKMIYKKVEKIFIEHNVEVIKSEGEPFDPDLHHAVMAREEEGVEPDMVLEEFEKGYKYKDRVLRFTKVVVSK